MSLAHIPLSDITTALVAALRVTAVTSLALGGVHNSAPQNVTYPFVRVIVRGKPIGPIAGSAIWECEAEVDVFSAYQGDAQSFTIANVIAGLLNLQSLTIAGWTLLFQSLLDIVDIPDAELNGIPVKQLTLPMLIQVEAA